MLDKGIVRASSPPWSAPAILVPKKTADGKQKYRFCVDFRALNAATKFDPYPLPVFEETMSTLSGRDTFLFSNVIVDSGRFPLRRNIKSPLDLRFHRDIINLTGYHSDCQTDHQISNGLWT